VEAPPSFSFPRLDTKQTNRKNKQTRNFSHQVLQASRTKRAMKDDDDYETWKKTKTTQNKKMHLFIYR